MTSVASIRQHRTKWSQAKIARYVGVSRATVSEWAKQLALGGLRKLRRRKPSGRPAKLTKAQQKRLLHLLKRDAKQSGFRTER